MTALCPRRWGAPLAGLIALGACRASVPVASPAAPGETAAPAPVRPASGFPVARYAESVPITAIAVGAPYLWAGTEHGLRRWKVAGKGNAADADADAEALGAETGLPGHRIDALATDDDRGVWVATEAGIGRLAEKSGRLRYETRGTIAAPVYLLAPSGAGAGAWAAGIAGLYRYDGHAWTELDFLRDVVVSSLDLDEDGKTVWVGTRGRGLYRVDARGGAPVLAPGDGGAAEEIVGTARSVGGARVVATRAVDGGRVTLVTKDGTEEYRTQSNARVTFTRLIAAGVRPVLIARGASGGERFYELRPLPRGEPPVPGGFRLVSSRKGSPARYQAVPMPLAAPSDITVVASAGGGGEDEAPAIWCGSRTMGVARAATSRPRYLSGDLTEDAERLSVACAAVGRCFVVAGGAHAWFFDGARFRETRVGESAPGRALAVVHDGAGAVFGVITDPPFESIALTRLAPGGAGPPREGDWPTIQRVPLVAAAHDSRNDSRPAVTFATFAPGGNLWLGLAIVGKDGQEQGRGALEITLPPAGSTKGTVVRHGGAPGKAATAESLPLPHDLNAVLFDGAATWFAARSGIARLQESELRQWGENEHMSSEVCLDVAKGSDGKIWVATPAGVGRFDGNEWRFAAEGPKGDGDGDGAVATRAILNDGGGHMWLATAKGLRALDAAAADAPRLGAGDLIVEDDMHDLAFDPYGRVWALGDAALAIVDTGRDAHVAAATTTSKPSSSTTSPPSATAGGTR